MVNCTCYNGNVEKKNPEKSLITQKKINPWISLDLLLKVNSQAIEANNISGSNLQGYLLYCY